jgi:hypothetical protein
MKNQKLVKSSTLWNTYSMLKLTLNIRDGIDVTKFLKLVPFLEKESIGYQAKKSKVGIDTRADQYFYKKLVMKIIYCGR